MNYISVKEASEVWGCTERRVTALCRDGRIVGARKDGKCWLVPENSPMPDDARRKVTQENIDVERTTVGFTACGTYENVYNAFKKTYDKKPQNIAFTPYRICPIGAHVDHNFGKITGFAIDKGIYMAYGPKCNGIIEIKSLQFPKRAQWHIAAIPGEKQNDWADHLRGAAMALNEKYPLRVGLCAVIDGELPIGGLSSSAAVIITFLSALCDLNGIKLSPKELVEISQNAENKYVGVSCGKLDQSCEIYCRKDKLLYMDIKTDEYELIPMPKKMKPYEIIVFFSGVERSLAGSKYNQRVDECRSAAYALLAFSGAEYGKYAETSLRDVPYETFCKYKDKLPDNWRKRAEHWYSECERAEKGAAAWRNGDIEEFGKLCFESGKSSIYSWETGSAELKKLYEIMTETKGIYGGRFSGAGFKGCCIALVDPQYEEEILNNVKEKYLKTFPELKEKYSAHVCHSADGVKL